MKLEEITIRDPFILADRKSKTYYLYGTNYPYSGMAFYTFKSKDLENWEGPYQIFFPESDFWGTQDFWAPEVHEYQGRYYLFATFKAPNHTRGCQILSSPSPEGPFVIHSKIITPEQWEALDGTFYLENGIPYMIFSHEWLQIDHGTLCAIQLNSDLTAPVGDPINLIHAETVPWVSHRPPWANREITVTDGPFVFQKGSNKALLWSSYSANGYAIGVSYPNHSFVEPSYRHEQETLPIIDGGHGMVFTSFDEHDYLVVHRNNTHGGKERTALYPIFFVDGHLKVIV